MALSDNIWWTRKARIQAADRLLANDIHTQILLAWYSFIGLASSIYFLKFDPNNDVATVAAVLYSIMVLCLSLFMSGRNFKERGMLMKQCYEQLETLYRETKNSENDSENGCQDEKKIMLISDKYQNILGSTENHKERDFQLAIFKLWFSGEKITDKKVNWYINIQIIISRLFRFAYLCLFYAFPVLILYFLLKYSISPLC